MFVFEAKNSNDMACKVYQELDDFGVIDTSRNGKVLRFPEPVTTVYTQPWHRANFTKGRDANPFFHIAEAVWMLAGRRDVEFISYYNSQMAQYSDDGESFNAAYGYRMRRAFGRDQLKLVVKELENAPDSRQAVIQLWDSNDLFTKTKDKACNMIMVFQVNNMINIDLTVYNRSNDLVYGGVTGSNPVHFSYFQQWVADQLGIQMGKLRFVSTNAHVYLDLYDHFDRMEWDTEPVTFRAKEYPLGELEEIEFFASKIFKEKVVEEEFSNMHIEKIWKPLLNAWGVRKEGGNPSFWLEECDCLALQWACRMWIERRNK